VSARELVVRTLAANLETPHAGEMVSQLIGNRNVLAEVELASAVGRPLSAVRAEHAGLVLGLVQNGVFTLGIGEDPVVAAGDRLLIAEATRNRPECGGLYLIDRRTKYAESTGGSSS
jgi:hypothetical protein